MHAEIFVQDLAQRHAPVLPAAATSAALSRQRRHLHACAATTVVPADSADMAAHVT
jgi:hypothetical protein